MNAFQEKTALEWAELACRSLMNKYDSIELPPKNRWHYHQGVFLWSMLDVWEHTDNNDYYQYVKRYVDGLIDASGNFLFARGELDAIQAGLLLFPLYKETNDKRYFIAASKLRHLLNTLNQTKEGGFWHKDHYPYQMWLDGLYMAGPFAIQYGQWYGEPGLVELVLKQEQLMRKYTKDVKSGLYYHGYDESKSAIWATEAGHAPEIWGRALGWYAMVLTLFLDLLPNDHSERPALRRVLVELIESLIKYRDQESGLWYQVVDKGDHQDNWLEASCSCLFIYTIAKAIKKGYIGEEYVPIVDESYQCLIKEKIDFDEKGHLLLKDICIGTSIGTYDYYINREVCVNDLHGVGAFVLASIQIAQLRV
ncbi:glycoside hydrolase family 88/105 protein [Amphibacillus cookii]|uniref:glycoside hydrolase family 88/105 protein n=1 Tax=Amphibacillus cookii TaxID=767787 RepID=UPI0019575CDC|nr:glycoside hydrolase family 88 protein [Amphibacillus cookii]MBM7540704.1 unsaturated rhamnogalacturonyl hydrolase [Amphibacillus cookii]